MGRGLSFKRHKALALDRIKHDQLRLAADRLCFFDRRRGSQHVMPVDALYIPAECLPLGLVRSDRLDIGDEAIDLPLVVIQKDRQIIQLLMRPVRVLIIQAHGDMEPPTWPLPNDAITVSASSRACLAFVSRNSRLSSIK